MVARPLGLPPTLLSTDAALPVTAIDPALLIRVSSYVSGEPHFGATGANRFDAPANLDGIHAYRACYFGFELDVAIAESLLHDAIAVDGHFPVAASTLRQRYVHCFTGATLRLFELTGAQLKRLGGHADLAGTTNYRLTQQWALAVHQNPLMFDGFIYMSRHLNTGRAAVLFDRAGGKVKVAGMPIGLCDSAGFHAAASALGIVPP